MKDVRRKGNNQIITNEMEMLILVNDKGDYDRVEEVSEGSAMPFQVEPTDFDLFAAKNTVLVLYLKYMVEPIRLGLPIALYELFEGAKTVNAAASMYYSEKYKERLLELKKETLKDYYNFICDWYVLGNECRFFTVQRIELIMRKFEAIEIEFMNDSIEYGKAKEIDPYICRVLR